MYASPCGAQLRETGCTRTITRASSLGLALQGYAALGMTPYGLTPSEDQQLAGLLMWVPGGLLHAMVALLLLRRILQDRPTPQAWRTDLAAPLADAPPQIRTES